MIVLAQLIREIVATLRDPRAFCREVLLPRDHSLRVSATVAGLAVALNMLQMALIYVLAFPAARQEFANLSGDEAMEAIPLPFLEFVLIMGAVAIGQIVLLTIGGLHIGRFAGGTASLEDMAAVISWHALCVVGVSIVVSALDILLGPSIGAMIAIAALLYGFWVLASLIGEAHGFRRTGIVAVGIVMSLGAFAMALGVTAAILGSMLGIS